MDDTTEKVVFRPDGHVTVNGFLRSVELSYLPRVC
jgi:hypothetical protein